MSLRFKKGKISNRSNNKFVVILLFFSLYFYLYIFNCLETKNNDNNYKKIEDFMSINSKSFFYTFFIENEIDKIKKFWKYNRNNELIDKKNMINKRNLIPDVSVIITVNNQENCLFKALRSVQNQSIKNIEIIIVDDFSSDNSISLISKYQNSDDRIILLKHMYN